MSDIARVLQPGDQLPDIRLQTADGGELALASLRGRPLVIVCVRYYG
jgi:peroxiredoxin